MRICARSAGLKPARFTTMSPEMATALDRLGYEVPYRKPTQKLTDDDLEQCDLILPMDDENLWELITTKPHVSDKVYDPNCFSHAWSEVVDPYKKFEERDQFLVNMLPRVVRNRILGLYHPVDDTKQLMNNVYTPAARKIQRAIGLTLSKMISDPKYKPYLT